MKARPKDYLDPPPRLQGSSCPCDDMTPLAVPPPHFKGNGVFSPGLPVPQLWYTLQQDHWKTRRGQFLGPLCASFTCRHRPFFSFPIFIHHNDYRLLQRVRHSSDDINTLWRRNGCGVNVAEHIIVAVSPPFPSIPILLTSNGDDDFAQASITPGVMSPAFPRSPAFLSTTRLSRGKSWSTTSLPVAIAVRENHAATFRPP